MDALDIFSKYLTEAPGDEPPAPPDTDTGGDDSPPELPVEDAPGDDMPPDLGGDENFGDDMGDMPPEMGGGDMGGEVMPGEEELAGYGDENTGEEGEEENPYANMGLDEKISNILNLNLYQRFLSLLNTLTSEITSLKDNNDMIQSLNEEALNIVEKLRKLEENVNLYLKNYFMNENYSKNLLFFNKCLNLLKLLNDSFSEMINKGIKASNNSNN